MIETIFMLATVWSALKITLWIFLGIGLFYAIFMIGTAIGGLEFIGKFFGTLYFLFWAAIIFGIIFLIVFGIQSMFGI